MEAPKITARWWLGWFEPLFTEVKAAPLIGLSTDWWLVVVQSLKLCPALCDPMDCSVPGFLVLHFIEFPQSLCIESVMLSNHLILFHPFLLLPSVFPSIRVFSSESTVSIRWSQYRSFSISCNILLMLVNDYSTCYLNRMMNHPIPVYFHKLCR